MGKTACRARAPKRSIQQGKFSPDSNELDLLFLYEGCLAVPVGQLNQDDDDGR